MKRAALCFATTAVLAAATVSFNEMRGVERSIDQRIDRHNVADPIDLLGFTRGVYLEGTGAVFTAEVNLVQSAALSPFRTTIPKEDVVKVHERKKSRLPELRKLIQDSLVNSATALRTLPAQEQVVLGISMFYHPWEDATGLPHQILMRARKQALLDFERGTLTSLEGAVQVQEF
jgi:hypothetical protein